jgi:hypothetical protein
LLCTLVVGMVCAIGMTRKPYPSDVSDEEWAFVAPCLTLLTEDAPRREVFNGLRWIARTSEPVHVAERFAAMAHRVPVDPALACGQGLRESGP